MSHLLDAVLLGGDARPADDSAVDILLLGRGPRTASNDEEARRSLLGPEYLSGAQLSAPKSRIATCLGNENLAQSFSDRSFWKPLRVVDVRAFGSWMSVPKCLFFSRILSALTKVLGRDIRANDPRMSAGDPSQKLPLWAAFSFLIASDLHRRPKGPCHSKNTTVIVIHYGGSKTLRRQ